mgnify:FL=1
MIGMYAEHSSTFLRVFAVLTGVVFSLLIFVAPLTWARIFRWQVDARADLALYFGRCLGAFAVIISSTAWYVAGHPTLQPLVFTMLITFFVLMVVVHTLGALQKVQPWTETAEIPFWLGLAVLGVVFFPTA